MNILVGTSRNMVVGACLFGCSMTAGCTGDAAMDASLASITGAFIAAATGDQSTANDLASFSQATYSESLTGAYRYDDENTSK